MNLKALIRDVPDFPSPGILFRDITPLLKDPSALDYIAENLISAEDLSQVDFIAGLESRGFILAMLLAAKFNKGFLPIRKAGKLPPPTVKVDYKLEYGTASVELNPLSKAETKKKVLVVDDVLATGGTLSAGIRVCEEAGYEVQQVAVLIDLPFLNQMTFKGQKVRSLVQY